MAEMMPRTKIQRSRGDLVFLLMSMLLVSASIEGGARLLRDRRPLTVRVEQSIRQAASIKPTPDHVQVLIVGNSLVYDGVDRNAFQQGAGSKYRVHASGIPGSTFSDWKYGIEALFDRGSKPDVLVLAMSPAQVLRSAKATDTVAAKLWLSRQVLSYSLTEGTGPDQFAELVLDHYSTFFYLRQTFRIFVRKLIPGYEGIANTLLANPAISAAKPGTNEVLIARYRDQLSATESMCRGHNARFIFLIVPTRQVEDAKEEPALEVAAQSLGIQVISPVSEQEWPLSQYKPDGYHLSAQAASVFSTLAGTELKRKLESNAAEGGRTVSGGS